VIVLLDRYWRVLGTGFCFAVFGIGGTLLSLTLFPVLRLLAGTRERAQPLIRAALRHSFRLFAGLMRTLGLVSWEVRGQERLLKPGQLIVANHPTLIDVVLLLSLVPDATCVVKRGLWRNPFLRWPVAWAGYIPNNESQTLVRDCSAALRAGHSLLMFPEGSRTTPGQPLKLKRGAAQIAIASAAPVLPVVITCEPLMLTKHAPWYRVPPRPGHWVLAVGMPVPDSLVRHPAPPSIAARHLTQHLAALFAKGPAPQVEDARPVTVTHANAPMSAPPAYNRRA
jgi:1-acyl-sn-glycerol-3-phosphate acyltransferase